MIDLLSMTTSDFRLQHGTWSLGGQRTPAQRIHIRKAHSPPPLRARNPSIIGPLFSGTMRLGQTSMQSVAKLGRVGYKNSSYGGGSRFWVGLVAAEALKPNGR